MEQAFNQWLESNGLVKVFTTNAGDTFYANKQKKFGVLRKNGSYYVDSFYFDEILEFRTYDDENLLTEWSLYLPNIRSLPKSNRHSTNEVYITFQLSNGRKLRLQVFKAVFSNISRDSQNHADLMNYAYQLSHIIYSYIKGIN